MQRAALLFVVLAVACVSVGKTVLDTSFQANPVERDNVFVYVAGDSINLRSIIVASRSVSRR